MTACTSFLAFFAEQTLAFAVKMHSRPDRWPQIVRFASGRADSLANRRFVNDLKWQTANQRFAIFICRYRTQMRGSVTTTSTVSSFSTTFALAATPALFKSFTVLSTAFTNRR